MAAEDRVTIYEMSEHARHFEIAFGGVGLARLYVEEFVDARGVRQSTCRLHFDGEVHDDVMRAVVDVVTREVLSHLPRGVCIVYRGQLVMSFDHGATARA